MEMMVTEVTKRDVVVEVNPREAFRALKNHMYAAYQMASTPHAFVMDGQICVPDPRGPQVVIVNPSKKQIDLVESFNKISNLL